MPNPDPEAPNPPVRLDDRLAMTLGSLGFGLAIPWLTGLYGPLGPRDGVFWLGLFGFIALALSIWAGNRWLLFKQRQHFDWFRHPLRKLLMLVVANVLYTAPVTLLGLLAWYAVAGLPVDGSTLQIVTLTNVICVLFVTHGYETLFLIRERESDLIRVERLQRLRAQAELAALKAQVDPHFLFNSLNTLGHLIQADPVRGPEFCDTLTVGNAVRPRRSALPSAGVGLANLDERCRLLTGRALQLRDADGRFEVGVPLQSGP